MKLKQHDIVIFGATSFVGKLICNYMSQQFSTQELSWALAGRSKEKLDKLKSSLGQKGATLDMIIADATDYEALKSMCEQTKVVVSAVGPYDLYGDTLIRACAQTGTDYCDLTGEPQWIKRMLDLYEEVAKKSGARIVHCAGFDSIPSDLGVYFLQREANSRFKAPCTSVRMRIKNMRGSLSGGTIATALNIAKVIKENSNVRRELANPYSLCPQGHGFKSRQKQVKVEYDEIFDTWVGPFFMSSINTRIVHRSNALSHSSYGEHFNYNEAVMTARGFRGKYRAKAIYWGLVLFFIAAGITPIRTLLSRFIVTKPGSGPSIEDQESGFYDFRFAGTTQTGDQIMTKVSGDMDPGYGSTAKIIGQAAACLAFDVPSNILGGFWTPSTILGDKLIDRLIADSGITFEVLDD